MVALRDGTDDLHEQIDSALRQADWLTSPAAYVAFLRRSLRFHQIVEAVIGPHVNDLGFEDWEWRPRSPLLEADLQTLVGAEGRRQTHDTPPGQMVVDGRAGAVGALYVVEGSALGARVLARWIRSRLGYDDSSGASSFGPYGDDTMERWRAFGRLAERSAQSRPQNLATMVAAARATFELHASLIGLTDRNLQTAGA